MSATEAQLRNSTELLKVNPFAARYFSEVVTPMLRYIYYLAQKAGRLPDMPQALKDNPEFKIDYIGPLSLATKSFETTGAFSTMNMFAEVAQYVPAAQQAFQNVDFDDVFRKTWYNNNATMTSLRPSADVEDEREAQAAAQARQEQQAAVLQGAQAAQMGSQAPEEGSPTQKMMEQAGV